MNSNIQDTQTKQKVSKKMLTRSIIATFFMVTSNPSFSDCSPPPPPPPPPPIGSNLSFLGDFESGTVIGSGIHNWRNIQAAASDRISLLQDSRGTYARVEIRNGDGCSSCTERSEVVMMQNANSNPIYENLNSGTQRYSFSVKFDPSWQAPDWSIFTQLHGPDNLGTNPAFAIDASDRITFQMRAGDITKSGGNDYELFNGDLNKGHWIDFILTVKYAADNTGFVNIQRRDEGQTNFTEVLNIVNTPTLQYSSNVNNGVVGDHYMKHGLYRSHQNFSSVLYLDGFTREKL